MKKITVSAKNISKMYKLHPSNGDRVRELLFSRSRAKSFYALKGVSFDAFEGDSIGFVGLNGSGKSTLANIIGGISQPTGGSIELCGESALISVNSGMNPQMTGLENIEYKGLLMGLTLKEIRARMPEIIAFADLGEFIRQPLKVYSSGMRARLGFAIAVNINPDIMVIDEALAVGDPSFTDKCLDKMNAFRQSNKTLFFVSHNLAQIGTFCNKALWLEYGVAKAFGPVDEVLPMYQRFISSYNKMTPAEKKAYVDHVIENQSHLLIG
ncbi:MAG: teichoic acids export ABC transporter ATP-binding subunit TagH [Clostridia bacterium]|nr:teichoic acids export ABC transporter ATP-binding subunit TagH [Clostridia bacterium]